MREQGFDDPSVTPEIQRMYTVVKPKDQATRKCLGCEKKFRSQDRSNRLCYECRQMAYGVADIGLGS
jgi:hypothetical protein